MQKSVLSLSRQIICILNGMMKICDIFLVRGDRVLNKRNKKCCDVEKIGNVIIQNLSKKIQKPKLHFNIPRYRQN